MLEPPREPPSIAAFTCLNIHIVLYQRSVASSRGTNPALFQELSALDETRDCLSAITNQKAGKVLKVRDLLVQAVCRSQRGHCPELIVDSVTLAQEFSLLLGDRKYEEVLLSLVLRVLF